MGWSCATLYGSSSAMETHKEQARAAASETTPPGSYAHNGLAMIHRVVGGYVARCLACQAIGPIWDTAEAARRALLDLETPHLT